MGPTQRQREKLRAETPQDRGLSRKAHIPSPECLTGNTLASPHGAGTMCFPWATTLLMSQVCYKNHGEHHRGKHGNFRQCACSCKATKPAVTLATVSKSLSREQHKCIREAFSCLPSQVRTSHMSGSLPSLPSLLFSRHGEFCGQPACSWPQLYHHLPQPLTVQCPQLITHGTKINELFS